MSDKSDMFLGAAAFQRLTVEIFLQNNCLGEAGNATVAGNDQKGKQSGDFLPGRKSGNLCSEDFQWSPITVGAVWRH